MGPRGSRPSPSPSSSQSQSQSQSLMTADLQSRNAVLQTQNNELSRIKSVLSSNLLTTQRLNTYANRKINALDDKNTQLQKTELSDIGYSILTVKKENDIINTKIDEQTIMNTIDNKKTFYSSIEIDYLKSFNFVVIILYFIIFIILIFFLFTGKQIANNYLKVFIFIVFLIYPFSIKFLENTSYNIVNYILMFNMTVIAFYVFIIFLCFLIIYLLFDYMKMAFMYSVDKVYFVFMYIWNFVKSFFYSAEQKV